MADLSPMMQQYCEIKEKNKDSILFFRLGDFYEMFFDDAKIASRELNLTLTGKDCGLPERAPMCGIPFHSYEGYLAKLVAKGYKVAICEQTEDPAKAKGIVKREIIRIVTPGTVLESSMLDEGKNNYIASLYGLGNDTGMCFCDISTGELLVTVVSDSTATGELVKNQLTAFSPREILIGGDVINIKKLDTFISEKLSASVEMFEDEKYDENKCRNELENQFPPDEFQKISQMPLVIKALGGLLEYLSVTQMVGLERINKIKIFTDSQYLRLDYNTCRNLELTQTVRGNEKKGSLLWVLDKTKTPMGKRLIRSWIEKPLMNICEIINRQSAVEELAGDTEKRMELAHLLSGISDMERLLTKIVYGSANGRDLRSLASTLEVLPSVKGYLQDSESSKLSEIYSQLDVLEDIFALIDNSIAVDPPFSVREGNIIKEGFNKELDVLRGDMTNSSQLLADIETREKEKTGIPKLKIGYNKVFGYYIEILNSSKDLVPDNYIRKQTLTNCERYITDDLKLLESRILGAKDRSVALEYELLDGIRKQVAENLDRIQKTATTIAVLDVLVSLANVAVDNRYVRPEISLDGVIKLKDSRHPVVEAILKNEPFVPNDVNLDNDNCRVAIITGPNMAGKSTYMRQTALIVIMAQMGSFVPASYAHVGIVDSVFTRVGASDDLAAGQSTFMVEMSEVANIVMNATSKSLLILDEIGRGTSTFDGMSIARAVLEYVVDKKKLGAKALFATHYHELTVLEDLLDGVKNYNIAVKRRGDDITFLRRIIPGGADDSYGVAVAKLAGVPDWIIKRANKILSELESGKKPDVPEQKKSSKQQASEFASPFLLTESAPSKVEERLKEIDVNTLTPIEALNVIYELKQLIE